MARCDLVGNVWATLCSLALVLFQNVGMVVAVEQLHMHRHKDARARARTNTRQHAR